MASMTCVHSIRKMVWLARDVELKLCLVSHLGSSSDRRFQGPVSDLFFAENNSTLIRWTSQGIDMRID